MQKRQDKSESRAYKHTLKMMKLSTAANLKMAAMSFSMKQVPGLAKDEEAKDTGSSSESDGD